MKQLKIRDLKILLELVETKSFTLSAKSIGLSQTSISKSIAAVEDALGIKLIDRDNRPVGLTMFGNIILPYIKEYVINNDKIFEQVEHYRNAPSGEVNIFCPSGMQAYISEHILLPFSKKFPDLNVTITTSNNYKADYFKGVSFNNSCDLLISYSPPHNHNLVARKVKRIRMDVFATPDFSASHTYTTPEELAQQPFILINSMANNGYNNVLELTHSKTFKTKKINVYGKLRFDNIFTAINCCRNGMGYMITSQLLLQNTTELIPTLPSEWGIFIDFYLIYRNRRDLPIRVQRSIDYIIELMEEGEITH